MKLKTFSLTVDEYGVLDDSAMSEALEGCEVLKVWERFLEEERVWLVMVGYRLNTTRGADATSKQEQRVGERKRARERLVATLDPLERQVFEALRAWRASTATLKQVGPHFILTNAQLVEVLKRNPTSLTGLQEVKGVGQGKVSEFGESLLSALAKAWTAEPQAVEGEG